MSPFDAYALLGAEARHWVFGSNPWRAITAVAEALRDMRKLSGQAVATLILESWVGPPPEKALPVSEHADNREEKETP